MNEKKKDGARTPSLCYDLRVMGRNLVAITACFLLVFAACGSSRTLQLSTGPITEEEFRLQIVKSTFVQPFALEIACGFFSLQSNPIPTQEFLKVFQRSVLISRKTPVATPVLEDQLRAVEIIEEECENLT